jgi:hypothetical protein
MARNLALLVLPVALALGASGPARAQAVKKGTFTGTVVTATAVGPSGGAAPVYTAPTSGAFVLTQLCTTQLPETGSLTSPSVGTLRPGSEDCELFEPGLAIAPGETLTCNGFPSSAVSCLITGVLSKK